jgi:hypothetical protein
MGAPAGDSRQNNWRDGWGLSAERQRGLNRQGAEGAKVGKYAEKGEELSPQMKRQMDADKKMGSRGGAENGWVCELAVKAFYWGLGKTKALLS